MSIVAKICIYKYEPTVNKKFYKKFFKIYIIDKNICTLIHILYAFCISLSLFYFIFIFKICAI